MCSGGARFAWQVAAGASSNGMFHLPVLAFICVTLVKAFAIFWDRLVSLVGKRFFEILKMISSVLLFL